MRSRASHVPDVHVIIMAARGPLPPAPPASAKADSSAAAAQAPVLPWWRRAVGGVYTGGDAPVLLWTRLAPSVRPSHLATFYAAVLMSTRGGLLLSHAPASMGASVYACACVCLYVCVCVCAE
jgi:hypothetical protein